MLFVNCLRIDRRFSTSFGRDVAKTAVRTAGVVGGLKIAAPTQPRASVRQAFPKTQRLRYNRGVKVSPTRRLILWPSCQRHLSWRRNTGTSAHSRGASWGSLVSTISLVATQPLPKPQQKPDETHGKRDRPRHHALECHHAERPTRAQLAAHSGDGCHAGRR